LCIRANSPAFYLLFSPLGLFFLFFFLLMQGNEPAKPAIAKDDIPEEYKIKTVSEQPLEELDSVLLQLYNCPDVCDYYLFFHCPTCTNRGFEVRSTNTRDSRQKIHHRHGSDIAHFGQISIDDCLELKGYWQ
jgi:hypothetical protein